MLKHLGWPSDKESACNFRLIMFPRWAIPVISRVTTPLEQQAKRTKKITAEILHVKSWLRVYALKGWKFDAGELRKSDNELLHKTGLKKLYCIILPVAPDSRSHITARYPFISRERSWPLNGLPILRTTTSLLYRWNNPSIGGSNDPYYPYRVGHLWPVQPPL